MDISVFGNVNIPEHIKNEARNIAQLADKLDITTGLAHDLYALSGGDMDAVVESSTMSSGLNSMKCKIVDERMSKIETGLEELERKVEELERKNNDHGQERDSNTEASGEHDAPRWHAGRMLRRNRH